MEAVGMGRLGMSCLEVRHWDFSGLPAAKTPGSQCRGSRFDPWLRNWIPHDATKTWHSQINI